MSAKKCVETLLGLVLIACIGCATPLSQEEARKVALETTSRTPFTPPPRSIAFTPPPRSIADILAVLDQPGAFDPEVTERLKLEAEAPLPSIEDDGYRAEFYFRRGNAAQSLGRERQALEDLRLAFAHMEKAGEERIDILRTLASHERSLGSLKRALQLLLRCQAIAAASPVRLDEGGYEPQLVELYLALGDLEGAEQAQAKAMAYCVSKPQYYNWRTERPQSHHIGRETRCLNLEASFAELNNRYDEAEPIRRRSLERSLMDPTQPQRSISNRLALAGNLRHQNRLSEAEFESRKALGEALGHSGRYSLLTARALRNLGQILRVQGRLEDAGKLARAGLQIMEALGIPDDSVRMYDARMAYGELLLRQGDWRGARAQYDRVRAALATHPEVAKKGFATANTILALIKTGAAGEALALIPVVYQRQAEAFGKEDPRTARLVGLRAMAHAAQNRHREAWADFAAALPLLWNREERFFPAVILDAYIHFLGRIHGTPFERELSVDAAAAAFATANALQQGATEAALNEACARLAVASDPDLEKRARQEQDLQKQIDTLEASLTNLLSLPPAEQDRSTFEAHLQSIAGLRKLRTSQREEIEKKFPRYRAFTDPPSVTLAETRRNLRPGEALVLIYPSEEKTFVWAIPQAGKSAFAISALGRQALADAVHKVRRSLEIHPRTVGEIPAFDIAGAHALYRTLLAPVAVGWQEASSLIVVAQGPLAQLPLALLPTTAADLKDFQEHRGGYFGGYRVIPWLIRRVAVTALPSVASLVNLRALPPGDPRRKPFVGFGDPFFSQEQYAQAGGMGRAGIGERQRPLELASLSTPMAVRGIRISGKESLDSERIRTSRLESLDRLPDTAEEIDGIARVLGADRGADVFYGREASEQRVKTMNLSDRKVIAFATHALVPRDLDGLEQPAIALASPTVTGEEGDGLLTMEEILGLKLNADWVVLSGCNTGAASGSGAEAVSGLGGAFFYAGARALLVSMWPVETTSGRRLITGIFTAQKEGGLTRAQAVQQSMLELIDRGELIAAASGKVAASLAHPFFWAPFVMVGDPGAGPERIDGEAGRVMTGSWVMRQ